MYGKAVRCDLGRACTRRRSSDGSERRDETAASTVGRRRPGCDRSRRCCCCRRSGRRRGTDTPSMMEVPRRSARLQQQTPDMKLGNRRRTARRAISVEISSHAAELQNHTRWTPPLPLASAVRLVALARSRRRHSGNLLLRPSKKPPQSLLQMKW